MCAYDGGGALLLAAGVDAGGLLRRPRVLDRARRAGGFRYRGGAALAHGLTRLVLKPASGGRRASGSRAPARRSALPELPVATTPVTMQLVRADDPTRCWQSTFATTRKNAADAYRASRCR